MDCVYISLEQKLIKINKFRCPSIIVMSFSTIKNSQTVLLRFVLMMDFNVNKLSFSVPKENVYPLKNFKISYLG
jgi:hypothetical protein